MGFSELAGVMQKNGVRQARHRDGVSIQDLEKAVTGNKPAIVGLDLDRGPHAVVVDGFAVRGGKRFVAVLDPAGETANSPGRAYLVPIEEFVRRFDGKAVLTNPITRGRQ